MAARRVRLHRRSTARTLRSPRLALALIGLMGLFIVVSFLVPQQSVLTAEEYRTWAADNRVVASVSEALGADSVFTSWFFIATLALLALNLIFCTYGRMIRSGTYPPRAPSQASDQAVHFTMDPSQESDTAFAGLAGRGWHVDWTDESTWVLWRGRAGRIGSIVLHLGLLLIMLGGIVSSLTRFSGSMVITEGQTVRDAPESYVQVRESPRIGGAFTGARIAMDSIGFTYERGIVSDAVARMRFAGGDGTWRTDDVRVNYPLHLEGKAYLLEKAGHAVALRITDPAGREALSSIINLGETGTDGSADELTLGEAVVKLTLISDKRYEGGKDPRKFELNDPRLYVSVEGQGVSGAATLAPGGLAKVDGWVIEFREARLWNRFMVRADDGRWITFVSFALIIIGMALRWLDPDAMVVIRRAGSGWTVWGRSRHGDMYVARHIRRLLDQLASPATPTQEEQ